jgi:HK97 family phage major capsid protein
MKTLKYAFIAFLALAAVSAFAGHPILSPDVFASLGFIPMVVGDTQLRELRDLRGKLVADARAIVDKADGEKRALTTEEDAKYNEIFGKAEETRSRIEREEKLVEAERSAAAAVAGGAGAAGGEGGQAAGQGGKPGTEARTGPRGTDQYRSAFNRFLASGRSALSEAEVRALQSDSDAAGGFMVASQQFVDQLIIFVNDSVFIRQKATKFRLESAQSMGAPSLEADPADADWTSELATGNEDGTMAFGKRELHPRPLAKRIKVSNKLLRMNSAAEGLVQARLAYKFAVTQEKAFMTGSGANQPLGVFTASANGIPTTRDISTGNLATSPTFDGLMGAKYGLKGNYWGKAEWIFHRDVLLAIAKLKNGEGQYIWRESVRAGEPDRLLNLPISMSEYAPNTMTTGLYAGILGCFEHYWIADALDMQVQRLVELYAETNQTGFIGRLESDGMPVLAEAFVRVKLG